MIENRKGNSVLKLPDSYVMLHVLTTGDDRMMDSVIEIGAVRYVNGRQIAIFNELCRPDSYYLVSKDRLGKLEDYCIVDGGPVQYIDRAVTKRTGITNQMLYGGKQLEEVLVLLKEFVGEDFLLGYDLVSQLEWFGEFSLCNEYVELGRLARRIRKDRSAPTLLEMAIYYEIKYGGERRALSYCELTNKVYKAMKEELTDHYGSAEEFERVVSPQIEYTTQIVPECQHGENPLYQKTCVFTGTLTKMVRGKAMHLVRECGGIPGTSVTKKTDYLILGNKEYKARMQGIKSTKLRKAESMVGSGSSLQIISEETFYAMVNMN